MTILQKYIKVIEKNDMLSYIPQSGRMVTPGNSYMDEANKRE